MTFASGGRPLPRPRRILQLIPAVGWTAVYREADGTSFYTPVVAFALVEEDGDADIRYVVPMNVDADGVDFADDASNFDGIVQTSTILGGAHTVAAFRRTPEDE